MYKLLNYLLLLATATVALTFAVSCGGDDPEPEPGPTPVEPKQEVKLSATALTFAAENAPEQTVTVTTASGIWSAKSDQDWCTASRRDNSTLVVTVGYNYGTSARTATVTVTSGDKTATLTVTQAGAVPTLTVDRDDIHFTPYGGDDIIRIHCTPTYYDLRCEVKGGEGWLTLSPTEDISDFIELAAAVNETFEQRSATLTITLPGADPHVVTVTQEAGYLTFAYGETAKTAFGYYPAFSSYMVSFETTLTTAEGITAKSSDDSWLHVTDLNYLQETHRTEGDHNITYHTGYFKVTVSNNDSYDSRSGSVQIFYNGKLWHTLSVTQYPTPRLSVVASHGTALPASGGTLDLKVYTNYNDWTVTEPASIQAGGKTWFTVERLNDTTIRLTAPARQGTTPRPDCTFMVTAGGLTAQPIIVERDGTAGEGYGYGAGTTWDGQ